MEKETMIHITSTIAVAEATHFPLSATLVLVTGFVAAATIGSIAWFRSERFSGWNSARRNKGEAADPEATAYDPGIVPAETAARRAREGIAFKQKPEGAGASDTTSGYTIDREGLVNNYAIEPEMYVKEQGDLKKKDLTK